MSDVDFRCSSEDALEKPGEMFFMAVQVLLKRRYVWYMEKRLVPQSQKGLKRELTHTYSCREKERERENMFLRLSQKKG